MTTDNVELVHVLADLEKLRTQSSQVMRRISTVLDTVDVALGRPVPKVEIVREVLSQLDDEIKAFQTKLEKLRA